MDIIVAVNSDWGIGKDGTQQIVIPEDRKRFRELTAGGTVIVGRKTLADFPNGKPLRNRRNIVLSRSDAEHDGADIVHSVDAAIKAAENDPNVFVIGGASVYTQFLPYCRRAFVTKIFAAPESSVFFPNLDALERWHITDMGEIKEYERVTYQFLTYENSGVIL